MSSETDDDDVLADRRSRLSSVPIVKDWIFDEEKCGPMDADGEYFE
jgi:hypothetical protein